MISAIVAHILLCAVAVAIAAAIAIPSALALAERPTFERPLSALLGALYTVPSLALLAVLVRFVGLGDTSVEIALVAYALYAIFRSTVAGIRAIPPEEREVAMALGLPAWRRRLRVDLPLAMPAILSGLRIATLGSIALATLGGYVGGSGLGSILFTGFALQNRAMLVEGALGVVALALLSEFVFRALEFRTQRL
uniref:Binding-protein-dependent transport systems inner membrane component n=1 Tax=mine drainage metagenome TaxID=410659 RepID=E6Q326_9ZZZZ